MSLSPRDGDEKLPPLTAERRKEISVKEAGNSSYRTSTSSYFRKEKALKIYTHNDDVEAKATGDVAGRGTSTQPTELD